MPSSIRINLEWGGAAHKFFKIIFNDRPNEDGSLYLALDRSPKARWDDETQSFRTPDLSKGERSLDRFRITYHTTGRINFHGMRSGKPITIYGEPIFNITKPLPLALLSLPRTDVLDRLPGSTDPADATLSVNQGSDTRIAVVLSILPDSDEFRDGISSPFVEVNLHGFLRVLAAVVPVPSNPLTGQEEAIWKWAPTVGPQPNQSTDMNKALILFHQKASGSSGTIICYWLIGTGEYRIIFSVPMRIAPRVTVGFADPTLSAEPSRLKPDHPTRFSEYWFRVRGRGGFVTAPVEIKWIEADAEF